MSAEDAARWRRQCEALHGKPLDVQRRLEACKHVGQWGKNELLRRWKWAIASYLDGFIERPVLDIEAAAFLEEAQSLIATDDLIRTLAGLAEEAKRPLTDIERDRRDEWLRSEAQRKERTEAKRQRWLLRQGHRTMSDIRRVLRGQAPLQSQVSEPARTLPTS